MSNVSSINGHDDDVNTCGKCIHYEICSPYTAPNESYPEVNGCKCFKAKEDLVEVVRCKDCEYFDGIDRCDHPSFDYDGYCFDFWLVVKPTDFCSYGERRGKE